MRCTSGGRVRKLTKCDADTIRVDLAPDQLAEISNNPVPYDARKDLNKEPMRRAVGNRAKRETPKTAHPPQQNSQAAANHVPQALVWKGEAPLNHFSENMIPAQYPRRRNL